MKMELFSVGPLTVHGYGFMIGLGIICCILLASHRAKKQGLSVDAVYDIAIWGVLSGFLGAKILYVIVEFPTFIADPLSILGSEGFVVYGGLIGGVLGAAIYARIKKLNFWKYLDIATPAISLAQGFGRLGCLMAGCCYGRETDAWYGIVFPEGCMAPAGVKLVPTQIISSLGNFLIMTILILYSKKSKHAGNVGAMYMVLYGVGRIGIEILRNDDRGALGTLSTSQFISIFIILGGILLFYLNKKRDEKTEVPVDETKEKETEE